VLPKLRNAPDFEEAWFMAGLEAHYSARDIEARILAAIRALTRKKRYRGRNVCVERRI
jgi:hypothetical protein